VQFGEDQNDGTAFADLTQRDHHFPENWISF
jgi:hypothetical protein